MSHARATGGSEGAGGSGVGGGDEGGRFLTPFGRARLDLMRELLPLVAEASAGAYVDGIGSGNWPAS
jgi:hypothetical protein